MAALLLYGIATVALALLLSFLLCLPFLVWHSRRSRKVTK